MAIEFSMVILTKNSVGVIENLVDAILDQEFEFEYEVIFMDNSSTDGTVDYLKSTAFKRKKAKITKQTHFAAVVCP